MARLYRAFENRAKAYVHLHHEVGRTHEPQTLYVVASLQPPVFLVGPPRYDIEESGAEALLTVTPGLPPEPEQEVDRAP